MSREETAEVIGGLVERIQAREDLRAAVDSVWVDRRRLDEGGRSHVTVQVACDGDLRHLAYWCYPLHGVVTDTDYRQPLIAALRSGERRLRPQLLDGDEGMRQSDELVPVYARPDRAAPVGGRA